MAQASNTARTLDSEEVARFARLSGRWWDERGPFRPLHRINPLRLTYIRDQLCRRFGRDAKGLASLSGLSVLDIDCCGGLVCEPLARLGADVTGIDPAAENIEAAKAHASAAVLDIVYEAATAEELAARGVSYDAVLLLGVVEHVPDVPAFLKGVAPLVKPGGVTILSTLNRTLKAYALAIVGAEYIAHYLDTALPPLPFEEPDQPPTLSAPWLPRASRSCTGAISAASCDLRCISAASV